MADLVTHVAVGYVLARPLRDPATRSLVLAGTVLPDVLYKSVVLGIRSSTWYAEPTHTPVGMLLFCGLIALLFEPRLRRRAFWGLLAGSLTHLAVDAGKSYLGHGVILWAFPFSLDRIEWGLYHNEDWPIMAPAAAGVILLTELIFRLRERKRASQTAPSAKG